LYQLDKNLSNPDYPYNTFGTGNLTSLKEEPTAKGLDVREAFMKFHDAYYSSNLMKLVVLGRESLDQLQDWVVEKFSDIQNKELPRPDFKGQPFTEKELQVRDPSHSLLTSSMKSGQNRSKIDECLSSCSRSQILDLTFEVDLPM
jgi:secreted Zn-dependent insulinase-like peptidase